MRTACKVVNTAKKRGHITRIISTTVTIHFTKHMQTQKKSWQPSFFLTPPVVHNTSKLRTNPASIIYTLHCHFIGPVHLMKVPVTVGLGNSNAGFPKCKSLQRVPECTTDWYWLLHIWHCLRSHSVYLTCNNKCRERDTADY